MPPKESLDVDKVVKFALVIGALLAGFGVFYHYVIFLPGVQRAELAAAEREKQEAAAAAEREKQEAAAAADREKQEAERREAQRRIAYDSCLDKVRANYDADWAAACKSVAATREISLKDCLSNQTIMNNPYLGAQHCNTTWGNADPSPDCTLPKARADPIDARNQRDKDRCATEARLGLQ